MKCTKGKDYSDLPKKAYDPFIASVLSYSSNQTEPVPSSDWWAEALRSLVDRYQCIADDPRGHFGGHAEASLSLQPPDWSLQLPECTLQLPDWSLDGARGLLDLQHLS